jgi:hypothetical protein
MFRTINGAHASITLAAAISITASRISTGKPIAGDSGDGSHIGKGLSSRENSRSDAKVH